jgi:hypothetical protein
MHSSGGFKWCARSTARRVLTVVVALVTLASLGGCHHGATHLAQRPESSRSQQSAPSQTARGAQVDIFAVTVQGTQNNTWSDDYLVDESGPGGCQALYHDHGTLTASIKSATPAILTVFDDPASSSGISGTVNVRVHIDVQATATETRTGSNDSLCDFPGQPGTDCGHRSANLNLVLSYDGSNLQLANISPLYGPPEEWLISFLLLQCADWGYITTGGPPITTQVLKDAQNGDRGVPGYTSSSSGSVSGRLANTDVAASSAKDLSTTLYGHATRTYKGSGKSDAGSESISLAVSLKRLYQLKAGTQYNAPNCAALAAEIEGNEVSTTVYNMDWESPSYDRPIKSGSDIYRVKTRLILKGGKADVTLPNWANVANPDDVAAWKEFKAGLLKHELGHVKVLADFLRAHRKPVIFTGTLEDITSQMDAMLTTLRDELTRAHKRYHAKAGGSIPLTCK